MTPRLLLPCLLLLMPLPVQGRQTEPPDWALVRTQGMMKFVVVTKAKEARREVYQDAIRSLCPAGQYCKILFWSDRGQVPTALPMTDAQAAAQVASYTRNPRTGHDEFLMTCRIEKDPSKCF